MTRIDHEGDSIDFKAAVIVSSFQQINDISSSLFQTFN
jgi:hypothetical protein